MSAEPENAIGAAWLTQKIPPTRAEQVTRTSGQDTQEDKPSDTKATAAKGKQ